MPYSEEDAPFFFGRERERKIITANLFASSLTLLYGASGVGKSSVLCAGVIPNLHQLAQKSLTSRGTPQLTVVMFRDWQDDPVIRLKNLIRETVQETLNDQTFDFDHQSSTFTQVLDASTKYIEGRMFIILDQFEEYFLYHHRERSEKTFIVEFSRAVNHSDLPVSFLISIREDALSKLDLFRGWIPNLFDNLLRIEHLDFDAAHTAIVKPIEQYNRLREIDVPPIRIESGLVESVLQEVSIGGAIIKGHKPPIETTYLQLVMARLWDEEMRNNSRALRLEALHRLGGASYIVRTHLDHIMSELSLDEQEAAAQILNYLVTPSGTKIVLSLDDLVGFTNLPLREVVLVIDILSSPKARILRRIHPPPDKPEILRYEIFHDVLAPAILDWRSRFKQVQERSMMSKKSLWSKLLWK